MILSIRHKGLRLFWTKDDASRLPADQVNKIRNILLLLDAATQLTDLNFPGAALHPLKGNLDGYWAVTVKSNWRIVFKFVNGNVYLVDYLDYH
jgi:proteic killer suppression protein